jgi:hypothetical protein
VPDEGTEFEVIPGGLNLDNGMFKITVPLGQIAGTTGESIVISPMHADVENGQVSCLIELEGEIP